MKLICSMTFGSQLYGTNTESSDTDIKGVAIPSREEVLLGKIPATPFRFKTKKGEEKNTSKDIDCEIVGLHKFIREACEGQTYAFDMLHAPDNKKYFTSQIWKDLEANRSKFYTKNITATVDYCKGQADKYGLKGSRISDARRVLEWLKSQNSLDRLENCDLSTFPQGEHIVFHPAEEKDGIAMFEVCNRKIQVTNRIGYIKEMVNAFLDNYGKRAIQAANNEGIDWKAMSHALRAGVQVKSILKKGTIIYPLPEANTLRDVKLGKFSYDIVSKTLEDLIDEIKELSSISTLPEKVDTEYWDKWVIDIIDEFSVRERRFKRIVI